MSEPESSPEPVESNDPSNQRLICDAVKRAASMDHDEEWLKQSLSEFADMVVRMERGEPPLSKSDWVDVVPPKGERIGPGWPAG